jgi:hypothetical protein
MKLHTPFAAGCDRQARRLLASSLFLGGILPVAAHVGAPPPSAQFSVLPLSVVQQLALMPTDPAAELAADAKAGRNLPLRFAVPQYVVLTTTNSGTWEATPGGRLWRLRVISTNATDLNFGFTKFWLPKGASLYVISETDNSYQGPYTAAENNASGVLWTPIVPGPAGVIELFVPDGGTEEPRLVLTQISTGYRDMFHLRKDLTNPKAETCEIDVVCPQAAPWTNEIRSVARIQIAGTDLCSGTLVMDAPGDYRAFFLSANHCFSSSADASSVVVYWNYESPTCGMHGLGASATNNQTGATFRASKTDVDFFLIELNQLPPTSYNVYYAGWDRSGTAPSGAVGIHHPNADGKCISFSSNPLTTVNNCIGTGGSSSSTHWQVVWSLGVTETGSSGSAIWDPATHNLVGTLSGGGSDCSTPSDPDCYGKFSLAWGSGSSSATRLKDWLDPLNTGVTSVGGSNPSVPVITPAGAVVLAEGCLPGNGAVDPGEVVTVNFSLQDTGTGPTTNLVATLLATNGVTAPSGAQTYGALTAGGAAVARPFTFMATGTCGGLILPTFQLQDGAKNLGIATFTMSLGAVNPGVPFSQNFDGASAPALPAGWTSVGTSPWTTSTSRSYSSPNSAFVADPATITDNSLLSPVVYSTSPSAQLTFHHYYNTESGYDGCVLEIAVNHGAFTDILSAGGSFVSGGYSGTISADYGNPLAGRSGWTGNSGAFVTTTVNLPSGAVSNVVQFRWRLGSDSSTAGTGWYVDSISGFGLSQVSYACCTAAPAPTLSALQYNPTDRTFQFNVNGGAGYAYAVLGSTDLSNWVPLITNTSPFTFTDSNAPAYSRRFYRTRYP